MIDDPETMRYTVTINLSQEDLAALACQGYKPFYSQRSKNWWAKPTQRDVAEFVRDSVGDQLHKFYICSGAGRKDYLDEWKKSRD